ncbi:carbohydrate ABC transporter permease [Ancylobacter mangrovi]|uniref:Sugar ABC transporter permease n=1 Tax=Ancylobacter mangrovi TaxID=2972472 RepID=A0A9X2PC15_9HYPH|nr:sugar ABC transporter permease [Ancylobacter mangrovi]MCS0494629.1 sugar ABC transporter permease [Ancylobacter mangrovi]MCS0502030.1 sugar ABC transporter permease [Ancylobacter mangrovi]
MALHSARESYPGQNTPGLRDQAGGRGKALRSIIGTAIVAPWLLPALLIIGLVQIGPMLYAIWLSLYEKDAFSFTWDWVGLGNYETLLQSAEFWSAAGFGVWFAVLSVVVQLAVGVPVALLLHQNLRGRGLARGIVLLPYMVPTAAMALVFALMMSDIYGVFDHILVSLGLIDEPIPFLGSHAWALPATLVASTWKWTPFVVIVILARLQTIEVSLYECAKVEGANAFQRFRDVTLPSLRSTLLLIVMLRCIWMFNKFEVPYLLTKGGPGSETTNLPIYAYKVTFLQNQQGLGAALCVVMFAMLFIFASIYTSIVKPEKEIEVE